MINIFDIRYWGYFLAGYLPWFFVGGILSLVTRSMVFVFVFLIFGIEAGIIMAQDKKIKDLELTALTGESK